MSESMRSVAVRAAAMALLAALGACGRNPVEPKLVGSWQTAIASPNGPYQLRLTAAANGAYRIDSQGPAPVPAETGAFTATGGKWRREKLAGGSEEGTYEFVSADSVLFKSKTETLLWTRAPNDAGGPNLQEATAAAKVPQGAATKPPTGGVQQPSAELIAAGPFGAPLVPVAAMPAQQPSSEAGRASGGFAPPAEGPAAGGANGLTAAGGVSSPPQSPSSAPAADSEPLQPAAVVQRAQQATARAKTSTKQATAEVKASASEAASAVKAEADDAEKHAGPFRRVGSKIKNFFGGHKEEANDAGSSSTQQDNH